MTYDIAIRNAEVIDGSDSPPFSSDVAVKNGRIVKIGSLGSQAAEQDLEAAELTLSPGFIDSHSHADLVFAFGDEEHEKLRMGVTSEIIGQCGFSVYPLSAEYASLRQQSMSGFLPGRSLSWTWSNLSEYKAFVEKNGLTHNVIPLVGHGSIRQAVSGNSHLKPSPEQLNQMRRFLEETIKAGAYGLSSGLIYPPGCFSDADELISLCQVAANNRGFYSTHIRGESAVLIDAALNEALKVGQIVGLPIHISHLKVIGLREQDRNSIVQVLEKIDLARAEGTDVSFDCYPYTKGSTLLSALLPLWAHQGGTEGLLDRLQSTQQRKKIRSSIEASDFEGENWLKTCGFKAVTISSVPDQSFKSYVGRDLHEIASETGRDPYDELFDLLIRARGNIFMVFSMLRTEDMKIAIKHPLSMIGTDALPCPPGSGKPHPRGYGTFPRILGRYVRDEDLMPLTTAVHKMTGAPAARFGLKNRGLIAEGMWADIVLFNKHTIRDHSTYEDPRQYPNGISYVIVNGQVALKDGKIMATDCGRVL